MTDEKMIPCPVCACEYTYPMNHLMVCTECAHEWNPEEKEENQDFGSDQLIVKDAHGAILKDGDSVSIIKDLPVKGFSKAIKVGTKVTNIRLVDGDHNIDCKVPGFGAMALKSEFVKKV
ncbi:MAG: alkylphosphonate utilization protein [Bacteroidia bacterium]|nr:alkylphosphonate utilization protein [Bacteroidia bacterium]